MYTGIVILGRLTCFLESGLPGIWFLSSVVVAEGDDPDRDRMVRDKKRGAEAPLTVSLALRT